MIRLQRGIGCLQIIPCFPCFEGKRRHAVWWRLYFPASDLIYCCASACVKGCWELTVILGVDLGEGPGIHTGFYFFLKEGRTGHWGGICFVILCPTNQSLRSDRAQPRVNLLPRGPLTAVAASTINITTSFFIYSDTFVFSWNTQLAAAFANANESI